MSNSTAMARQIITQRRDAIMAALPHVIDKDRFYQIALSVASSVDLSKVNDGASIAHAVYGCAKLGLIPDKALGHIWIIPRKGRAELQVGYKGLVELATRSGDIAAIHVEPVFAGCEFDVRYGTHRRIDHVPWFVRDGEQGGLKWVYTTWLDKRSGTVEFHVTTMARIERAMKASQSLSSGRQSPWDSDYIPMCLKTGVIDASKTWPLTERMATALKWAHQAEAGEAQDLPNVTGDEQETEATTIEQTGFEAFEDAGDTGDDAPLDNDAIDAALGASK